MAVLSDKYIFIHIYKTGGNSIRKAFDMERNGREVLTVHVNASQVIGSIGQAEYDKRLSFAFVRHPYDWCLSLYHYIRRAAGHQFNGQAASMSLCEFVHFLGQTLITMEYPPGTDRHQTLTDFTHRNGKLAVDFIGRFERLIPDTMEIASRLGITINESEFPRRNIGDHERRELTAEEKDAVYRYFAVDFDTFKYAR